MDNAIGRTRRAKARKTGTSYVAVYWSTDSKRPMLGGVGKATTSRWELREQAEERLQGIIDVHAKLDSPLVVAGEVREIAGKPEIFSDGSCIGFNWGKAKVNSND